MTQEMIVTAIGLFTSFSSIIFALLAFKRSEKPDYKKRRKKRGINSS